MKLSTRLSLKGEEWIAKMRFNRVRNHHVGMIRKMLDQFDLPPLTDDEREQVHEQWKQLPFVPYEDEYPLFKYYDRFDPKYVTRDTQYPFLYNSLNPLHARHALSNKGMYQVYMERIPQPQTVLTCVDGNYFDPQRRCISVDDAKRLLLDEGTCIVKPTIESMRGMGIRIIDPSKNDLSEWIEKGHPNFIVQRLLGQSAITERFNPTSLNTFRVTTLFLNGKVSVCSICFKFPSQGEQLDNLGRGGLIVGVEEDGSFNDFGVDKDYKKRYNTHDGTPLADIRIPEVNRVMELAMQYHPYYFPQLGIVGWDIALDANDRATMVEANLVTPGISAEQYCSRKPLFGDRTDEVIEHVKEHSENYVMLNGAF